VALFSTIKIATGGLLLEYQKQMSPTHDLYSQNPNLLEHKAAQPGVVCPEKSSSACW
jgi:hypothetical protein